MYCRTRHQIGYRVGVYNSQTPQKWPIPENIKDLGPRFRIFSDIGHNFGV